MEIVVTVRIVASFDPGVREELELWAREVEQRFTNAMDESISTGAFDDLGLQEAVSVEAEALAKLEDLAIPIDEDDDDDDLEPSFGKEGDDD